MISEWAGYFGAQAGAFAALTGLVFVALSINLKEILTQPGLPGRAGEAIIILVAPVAVGLVGLMPGQSLVALGVEVLVIGGAAVTAVTVIVVVGQEAIRQRPTREAAQRIVLAEVATALFVVAGAVLAAGDSSGLYWQAAAVGACLVVGITDAWVLLVEILR